MSTTFVNIQTPESGIVKDGLVLWYDTKSSQTNVSGDGIYDMSGNGNHTSLNDGTYATSVTYLEPSPDVGYPQKRLNFPGNSGTSGQVRFSCPQIAGSSAITVEMVAMLREPNSRMPFGFLRYDVWAYGNNIGFNTAAGDLYGIGGTSLWLNKNTHFAFVMRSDVSYTNNNKIYVNGVSQTLSQHRGSEEATNRNFNSGDGVIAGWKADGSYRMNQVVYVFRIYDRELSAEEVRRNYEAERRSVAI